MTTLARAQPYTYIHVSRVGIALFHAAGSVQSAAPRPATAAKYGRSLAWHKATAAAARFCLTGTVFLVTQSFR